jgi:hypothetical protein
MRPIAIVNCVQLVTLQSPARPRVPNGTMLVRDGKIDAVAEPRIMVVVADGSECGIIRPVDAGYEAAATAAREKHVRLPMAERGAATRGCHAGSPAGASPQFPE